jgi:hypothetical protein
LSSIFLIISFARRGNAPPTAATRELSSAIV